MQATAVYLFSITVSIIHYFIGREASKELGKWRKDFIPSASDKYEMLKNANLIWSGVVTYAFPIIFFGYVWITIKKRGYMPSATGSMKELVRICVHIFFSSKIQKTNAMISFLLNI